jgi:hypothetical protein
VSGLILKMRPSFCRMPLQSENRFVYQGLKHLVDTLGDPNHRDLADYFRGQALPIEQGQRERRLPEWMINLFSLV